MQSRCNQDEGRETIYSRKNKLTKFWSQTFNVRVGLAPTSFLELFYRTSQRPRARRSGMRFGAGSGSQMREGRRAA